MTLQLRIVEPPSSPDRWPEARAELVRLDARLRQVVQHAPPMAIPIIEDPFTALCLIVLYQQISGRVAQTMAARLRKELPGSLDDPIVLRDLTPSQLRPYGIPRSRADTLRRIATLVSEGELDLHALRELPDEDVRARLEAVPGIGSWTSGMFLLFHLGRPDVFLPGDIGIRKAIAQLTGTEQTAESAAAVAAAWRPWRSAAMWSLWHSLPDFPSPGVR